MFQFPRSPLACLLNSACDARSSTRRVAPFGNPRINACLRLPVAFRSLPRPSSAPVPRHPPCALSSLDLHRRISYIRLTHALPYSLAKLPLQFIKLNNGLLRIGSRINTLRKEVIQPHVPVRLPCYDFTPIISPTFNTLTACLQVLLTLMV